MSPGHGELVPVLILTAEKKEERKGEKRVTTFFAEGEVKHTHSEVLQYTIKCSKKGF